MMAGMMWMDEAIIYYSIGGNSGRRVATTSYPSYP